MATMNVPFETPIYVTRPFLPPLDVYAAGLKEIWSNAHLTNNGPVLQRFERKLAERLGTSNLSLMANGTLALQLALSGLRLKGEVITTPFTFAATTHALHWCNLKPVFADVEPEHYTIDPEQVEAAITPQTSAILAVHLYGYPCRLKELAAIARRHQLPLIYDAAHAFGVLVDGKPIGQFGDVSIFSFHATKLFHTGEGGMAMFRDPALKSSLNCLKDFGFADETDIIVRGTNAKMNELEALMGLLVLDQLDGIIERRKQVDAVYRERLDGVRGIRIPAHPGTDVDCNHAYFPIEIDAAVFGMNRDEVCERLKDFNVFARCYFYPLIPDMACYRDLKVAAPLTVARRVSGTILSLPIYDSLATADVVKICDILRSLGTGG